MDGMGQGRSGVNGLECNAGDRKPYERTAKPGGDGTGWAPKGAKGAGAAGQGRIGVERKGVDGQDWNGWQWLEKEWMAKAGS
jgi:hypothetical protein